MLSGAAVLFVNKSFCILFCFLKFSSAFSQVPSIVCPNYFEYFMENSRYIGRLTLPDVKPGITRLEVHLSQPGVVPTPNPAGLSLYDNEAVTVDKVLTSKPVLYRVEFPMPFILPKLTLISVNGKVLCADQDYPAPSGQVTLIHTLKMSAFTLLEPYRTRDNGFNAQTSNGLNGNRASVGNPFMEKEQQQQQQPTYNAKFYNPYANFGFTDAEGNAYNKAAAAATAAATPTAIPAVEQTHTTANLNEVCGRESATFTPLIRGGSQLQRGQFPWLTAIYRKKGTDLAFICGGSLITAHTVISAAHCFKEQNITANKILILLGRYNLATITEEGSVYRQVESLSLHPEYNPKSISDADVAILQLKQPVGFTSYITPICLWDLATDVSYIVGYSAVVAGWGATEQGEPVSLVPKKAAIKIVDDNSCRSSLQRFQIFLSSRTICARNEDSGGPCTGDSGGGLMILQQGRWLLRGIVSAGLTHYGQCTPNENFYFCDIAKHLNWIRSQIFA